MRYKAITFRTFKKHCKYLGGSSWCDHYGNKEYHKGCRSTKCPIWNRLRKKIAFLIYTTCGSKRS